MPPLNEDLAVFACNLFFLCAFPTLKGANLLATVLWRFLSLFCCIGSSVHAVLLVDGKTEAGLVGEIRNKVAKRPF